MSADKAATHCWLAPWAFLFAAGVACTQPVRFVRAEAEGSSTGMNWHDAWTDLQLAPAPGYDRASVQPATPLADSVTDPRTASGGFGRASTTVTWEPKGGSICPAARRMTRPTAIINGILSESSFSSQLAIRPSSFPWERRASKQSREAQERLTTGRCSRRRRDSPGRCLSPTRAESGSG